MGRARRQSAGGVVYHVLNRRVMRLPLFEDAGDYRAFLRVLGAALDREDAPRVYAFCLMPNHWHLLLEPRRDGELSTWMQWLSVTHTHRWHKHHGTAGSGPVYQGRFKSFPVQADEHFLTVARYVERNPLRAKRVDRAQDWAWSSLRARRGRAGDAEASRLRERLSEWPVARPRQWTRWVNQPQTAEEEAALATSIARGRPYGSAGWVARTAERLDLQNTLRRRGRPKKSS